MEQQPKHDIRMARLAANAIRGVSSPEEQVELSRWLDDAPANRAWYDAIREKHALTERLAGLKRYHVPEALGRLHRRFRYRALSRMAIAASALIVASLSAWFVLSESRQKRQTSGLAATDVAPGGNKATLTLADGTTVNLSAQQDGIVIADAITYLDGTQVIGNSKSNVGDEGARLNTITTPKGGTYRITLPDGSKVWLNAASTLKYPSRFTEESRGVFLEGEGYFEITSISGAQASRVPFNVQTVGQTVHVLGTEFNISAYPDDPETQTTLVAGRVRLEANGEQLQLVPGEQGNLSNGAFTARKVDTEAYIAWRDGKFVFQETPLSDVLRQLARWYDIEVDYTYLPKKSFNGDLPRNAPLSETLRLITLTSGVRLGVNERRLHVIN